MVSLPIVPVSAVPNPLLVGGIGTNGVPPLHGCRGYAPGCAIDALCRGFLVIVGDQSETRSEKNLDQQQLSFLVKATTFAALKHKDQRRLDPGRSPYINHPLALVDVLVHEAGHTDLRVLVAALLHDTIEDTDTTADEIEAEFGAEICSIVLEVTDDKGLSKAQRKQSQIAHAPTLSVEARAVKLADKICNLRDIACGPPRGWDLARCQAYFDWAKQVIDGLRGEHPQLEALFDAVFSERPCE